MGAVLIVSAVSALFIAACGGGSGSVPGGASGSGQAVAVKMSEFKYEPTTVEAKAGKVEFKLQNIGTVEHSFVIVGSGKGAPDVRPGVETTLEADLKPGTYTVECDIPGHKEAGMIMTLVVK